MGNFTPCLTQTPQPIITKSCTRDYAPDIYPHATFGHDPSKGFFSPICTKLRIKDVYSASFFTQLLFLSGFFQWPTAQAPEQIFTQNTSNDVVPHQDVPFRDYKTKI